MHATRLSFIIPTEPPNAHPTHEDFMYTLLPDPIHLYDLRLYVIRVFSRMKSIVASTIQHSNIQTNNQQRTQPLHSPRLGRDPQNSLKSFHCFSWSGRRGQAALPADGKFNIWASARLLHTRTGHLRPLYIYLMNHLWKEHRLFLASLNSVVPPHAQNNIYGLCGYDLL